ncbi:MAG TPA: Holliday junction branch migration protein RuvA [Candidatus Binatia bacterium]|jgi:Holliday junction DNA helicase RuvA
MIGRLRGTLALRLPGEVLVEAGGVGYQALISLQTFTSLPALGQNVQLEVVTVLRENALELFAFSTLAEKNAFQLLRSVSGIGPRMALAVLSGISVGELAAAVSGDNVKRLTAIPGIGRKTAERILIDLRGKLDGAAPPSAPGSAVDDDAVSALVGLGYKRGEAEKAVRQAASSANGLEEVLRTALASLVRSVAH